MSLSLTQPVVSLVVVVLPPAATQVLEDHGHVTEDDEGGREHGPFVEGHDELVALELPHLVGDGLDLDEGVAVGEFRRGRKSNTRQTRAPKTTVLHLEIL